MNQHFQFPAYSFLPRIALTIFVSFIVITSQPHQPFWFKICYQIRGLKKFSYGLLLNLITPWSVTGHFIFLKIFLSHVFNILLIK